VENLNPKDKLFCKEIKDAFKKGIELWKRFREG
jgi:hypothetical protein